MVFEIKAHWDGEAQVWWAESDDVKGLVAEADTLEALMRELRELVPELLRTNHGMSAGEATIRVIADRTEELRVAA